VLLVFGAPCQLPSLAGQEHGRTIPLTDLRPNPGVKFNKSVNNGWVNLSYRVDGVLLAAIVGAKSVIGVGLSPAPGAAIFSGFAYMPFEGGAAKLPGFLEVCGPR